MISIMRMMQSGSSSGQAAAALMRLASLLAIVLLLAAQLPDSVECQEQLSIESRQQKDSDDLSDTIKYLDKLDKYFSQIARPRFGRSEYKQAHRMQPSWLSRLPSRDASDVFMEPRYNSASAAGADLLDLAKSRSAY